MMTPTYAQRLELMLLKLQEMHTAQDILLAQLADLEAATRIMQDQYNATFNNAAAIAKIPNEILATISKKRICAKMALSAGCR